MNWDTAFFRNLFLGTFNSLNDYYETVEAQLKSLKENDRKRIDDYIGKLELGDEETYAEWSVAMQEHTATYSMLYSNFFRYSFVILLFLALEDWLHRLCLAVQDIKNHPNPLVQSKDMLRVYKQYLADTQISVDDKLWEVAHNLQKVRDCIVHTSGSVIRSRDEKHLRAMAQRKMGIKISSHVDRGDEKPLYLENNMLIIQPDYCKSTINNIKLLIEGLCDKVPLKELDFKNLFPKDSEI